MTDSFNKLKNIFNSLADSINPIDIQKIDALRLVDPNLREEDFINAYQEVKEENLEYSEITEEHLESQAKILFQYYIK